MMTPEQIITQLNLLPHPEGGYYKEIYRSHTETSFEGFNGNRNICTSIYYLLKKGEKSHLHRIKSDEIWHYYLGAPLVLLEYDLKEVKEILIGPQLDKNQLPQYVVEKGKWFGAYSQGDYTLVGATVSPGFDFQDFELAKPEDFIEHDEKIQSLILKN